jgi:hypothetical protein
MSVDNTRVLKYDDLSLNKGQARSTVTVTLHLRPEVEAGLVARAQANGMALEEFLLSLVEEAATSSPKEPNRTGHNAREEAVRRMLEFGEKYRLSLGEPITREFLHEGHRF